MKKAFRGTVIGLIISVLLLVAVYVLLGMYYMVGFPCFTWVNGVYCTGKTVYEVNEELVRDSAYDGIAILDKSGARLFVSASDVDMTIDYTDSLNEVFYSRNPFAWGFYVFKNLSREYEPTVYINKDKFFAIVSDWEVFVDPSDLECSIEKTSSGYLLVNGYVQVPIKEAVAQRAYECMAKRESVLDLTNNEDCYSVVDLRSKEKEKVELFSKIDRIQQMNLSYQVGGDTVTLNSCRASDFILTEKDLAAAREEKVNPKKPGSGLFLIGGEERLLSEEDLKILEGIVIDQEGNPVISESKLYAFLKNLADSHDTSWMMDKYRKGEGGEVIVNDNSKGDGTIYDIDSEFEYLRDALTSGSQLSGGRTFALSKDAAAYNATEQLGKTYIEVNMGDQVLHYYVNGELSMEMPIVTGNVNRGRGTPTGIFSVYNKRYHTYLRGVDYVSYVNYWLGVHKGVGIHDANWRNKFGDEIYKSDGSHGCINCPESSVSVLWEVVDVGTPVILYY